MLPTARAESCQVVATFVDIRGFSGFAVTSDSFDTAVYLSAVFSAILGSFSDVAYFKLTGDGLLLIHDLPSSRAEVPVVVSSILRRCVTLVEEFPEITSEDVLVNFAVPQSLGVGVARGPVTRLISDATVLDYTGRCLNLAARLMDKARPRGVVFADLRAVQLMEPDIADLFSSDEVFIRGLDEQEPTEIYVTEDVEITPADREPPSSSKNTWGTGTNLSVEDVLAHTGHGFYLPRPPRSYEIASVLVEIPIFNKDDKRARSVTSISLDGAVEEKPAGSLVRISFKDVHENLKGIPATTVSKVFSITKTTYVTFIPYCRPADEE